MAWKRRVAPLLLVVAGLACAAQGRAETKSTSAGSAKANSPVLAVVDGKIITARDVTSELSRRQGEQSIEQKEQLLDSLVAGELLFAAARRAGYDGDPEVLAAVRQVMIARYLRDTLEPRLVELDVTDQEAESYYRAHLADFGSPALVRAALIRIAVSPKASAETRAELRKRAESVRAQALGLDAGVPGFGTVAVAYSEDQGSRYRGGDIGWLRVGEADGRWDRRVSEAIFSLGAAGRVSGVVEAADGFYLVKLMEMKEAVVKPFAEVRDGVRYLAVREKRQRVEREFVEQLKKQIPVVVNREALAAAGEGKTDRKPPSLPNR